VPPRATTSSYAVLGLLAIRPWSAYDLAQQATRSLRYAHPRTESHLYEEPKRLVKLGWATARVEHHGRRPRTTYAITKAGRTALEQWLATSPHPPQLDFEALLRVLFADQAGKDDVIQALERSAESARQLHDDGKRLLAGYLADDDGGPFPDRRNIGALVAAFAGDYLRLVEDWSEFARREIEAWPTTTGLGLTGRTREIIEAVLSDRSPLADAPAPTSGR
jgi:PadR family transcriptional regulator, regulatory protein AphA